MIDVTTNRPLRVSDDGAGGPYLMVAVQQVGDVERVLRAADVCGYWVERDAIRLDGRPAVAFINLGRYADAGLVQTLLDAEA